MKVALIQMEVKAGDAEYNRSRGLALAEEAAKQADVLVLPEIWTIGYSLRGLEEIAEDWQGPTLTSMQDIAARYKKAIVCGSIPMRINGRIYNSTVIIDEQGQIVADYQKVHLFSLLSEEKFFAPGQHLTTFDLAGYRSGVAICYDLRFPEMFRSMTVMNNVNIVYLPAEWPAARKDAWRILCQARAMENQIYLCAVNCVGTFKENVFYGHSMLVAPNGEVLCEGSDQEEILYSTVEDGVVQKVRKKLTALADRRPDVYCHD